MEHHGIKRPRLDDPSVASQEHTPVTAPAATQLQSLVVHNVLCTREGDHMSHPPDVIYFDGPRLFKGDSRASALRGLQVLRDEIRGYMAVNGHVNIMIQREYDCPLFYNSISRTNAFIGLKQPDHPPVPLTMQPYFYRLSQTTEFAGHVREMLHVSQELREALDSLSQYAPPLRSWPSHLGAPYAKFYHVRESLRFLASQHLEAGMCQRVHHLMDHVERIAAASHREAETLFAQGLVARKHLSALFQEGQVIVEEPENGEPLAYVVTEGPHSQSVVCQVRGYRIIFDGKFRRSYKSMEVKWPVDAKGYPAKGAVPIDALNVYPLKFGATGDLEEDLRHRGELVWACRQRCLLEYHSPKTSFEVQQKNARYMVDYDMYRELEQDRNARESAEPHQNNDRDIIDVVDHDDPPDETFILLLPPEIKGFGLHDKRWRTLLARYLQPVRWQKEAFDQLHLESNKKDLIQAMVQMHISSNISSDVIEGKGKGLIILLHGGPGTGKTLTAESVAELAERPLYRVTCGDIGTSPESVENYLESVLYIGSTWKAVVLLDESDVFLEEREKSDLQRNALVSVFLRVLEYYDGILILTSNRVGTFDEAFKSRVQLTLHYPSLDEQGRLGIWNNFFQLLQGQSKEVDPRDRRMIKLENDEIINIKDLKDKIELLAKHSLNGREIRNVITSARQLARFRGKPMDSSHLKQAITVVDEFQSYVKKMHGHTDEQYAEYKGERAA